MKYFININTSEELRKAYRALCLTMHPDRGGNEEEFKAMQNEFEALKKSFMNGTAGRKAYTYTHTETAEQKARREAEEAREREEWARWEREEKARREQEEREKAERIRKAQEASRKAVSEWADRLERIAEDMTGTKARYYRFDDKKKAAAFVAATKRNIKAVINHYFPGLKVAVNISGEIWKEKFIISWQDGPTAKALRDTCKELRYFVPSYYEMAGPCDDYGCYREDEATQPWREAYGQALGDATDFETARTLSEEGREQAEALAASIFKNWKNDTDHGRGTFTATLGEWWKLAEALGRKTDKYGCIEWDGMNWGTFANWERRDDEGNDIADFYYSSVRKLLRENAAVNVTPKEKAPEFAPKYGPAYKAIKKALAGNVFFIDGATKRSTDARELSIFDAAELLAERETVKIGHKYTNYDGETGIYGTDNGGSKLQIKRFAKFQEVGIILCGSGGWAGNYATITAENIDPATLEALRREAADIEKQRKDWELDQLTKQADKARKNRTERTKQTEPTAAKDTADEAATDEAKNADETATISDPKAAGLTLEEIPGGVAVTGSPRDTWKARKAIKAHGCHWNKGRKQWEATEPADVENCRKWFDTLEAAQEIEEPTEATADFSPVIEALADFLQTIATICKEAAKFEGVTIPAETLKRWRRETEEGTKQTAERLAEVCACLGSLTPEHRTKFDALGVIFCTLADQLRNGFDPAMINNATDFARAELFDLVERTQNPQQAAAVRAAFSPEEYPDFFRKAA